MEKWRTATKDEIATFLEQCLPKEDSNNKRNQSVLEVRTYLSPVDMYCYLKARFG